MPYTWTCESALVHPSRGLFIPDAAAAAVGMTFNLGQPRRPKYTYKYGSRRPHIVLSPTGVLKAEQTLGGTPGSP